MGNVYKTYTIGSLTFVDKNDDGIYQSGVDSIMDSKGETIPMQSVATHEDVKKFQDEYCLPKCNGLEGLKIKYLSELEYPMCYRVRFMSDKELEDLLYIKAENFHSISDLFSYKPIFLDTASSCLFDQVGEIKIKLTPFLCFGPCPSSTDQASGLIYESHVATNISKDEEIDFDRLDKK